MDLSRGGKVMKNLLFLIPFLLLVLVACSGEEEAKTDPVIKKEINNNNEIELTSEKFEELALRTNGGSFIKNTNLEDGNKGTINFYTFEELKKDRPDANITKENYKMYFDTGDGLEKILFKAPAYLFDKLPALDQLSVTLPYEGKTYSYDIKREEINDYIGADETDDELRRQFMDAFVEIK
jgi:hypothetical protein